MHDCNPSVTFVRACRLGFIRFRRLGHQRQGWFSRNTSIMQTLPASRCHFCKGAILRQQRPQARQQAALQACVTAKATKASDFRRLSDEDIEQQVQDAKRSLLLDFRVKQVRSQVRGGKAAAFRTTSIVCCYLQYISNHLRCFCCRQSQSVSSSGTWRQR